MLSAESIAAGRMPMKEYKIAVLDYSSGEVASAAPEMFGQVFGYKNLYVADGAIVPTAVGANPTATISALSEMVAQGITGEAPNSLL
jgi:hypothetical protein